VREDFTSHLYVRRPRCAHSAPCPKRTTGRPARRSSIFGRPLGIPRPESVVPLERLPQPRAARQPTCQCAALSSAHEQRKTAQIGRAALGLERICVSAPIVFDDLQSDTLRSLARARFGACQHLLTEGDYRHVETRVSRDFQLNFR
jgi:hypothetical protein